jgi:peptidoglycan/LPS O-acetylase OafA/YrhL
MDRLMDHTRALTGVRIIFALMVVFFHLSPEGAWLGQAGLGQGPQWLQNLLAAGHVGVQFFFVLSGFILALTYHDMTRDQDRAFYAARAARIYPVYLLGVVVTLPGLYLGVFRIDAEGRPALLTFVLQLAATLLLLQAWFPRWALVGNGPGWSLSAETFFYGFFPRLIRLFRMHATALLVAGVALLVAAKLVLGWYGWNASGLLLPEGALAAREYTFWFNFWHFNPALHLPEFFAGMVAYLLLRREVLSRAMLWWGTWLAVAVLVGVAVTRVVPDVHIHNGALILPCALLVMGLTVDSPLSRALGTGVMQLLGQASYAVYLLHGPLLWYLGRLDDRFLHLSGQHPLLMVAIYLAVLMGLCIAVFLCYEEPMRRRLRAWLGGSSRQPVAPAVAPAVVPAAGS